MFDNNITNATITAEVRFQLKGERERRQFGIVPLDTLKYVVKKLRRQYGDDLGIVYRLCHAESVEECKGLYNGY